MVGIYMCMYVHIDMFARAISVSMHVCMYMYAGGVPLGLSSPRVLVRVATAVVCLAFNACNRLWFQVCCYATSRPPPPLLRPSLKAHLCRVKLSEVK